MSELFRLMKYRCRWGWVRLQLAKHFACFERLAPFVGIQRKLDIWTDFDTHAITAEIVEAIKPWAKKIKRQSGATDRHRVAFYATGLRDETGGHTKLVVAQRKLLDGVYEMRLFAPDLKYATANGREVIKLFGGVDGIDLLDSADERSIVKMAQMIIDYNPRVVFAYTSCLNWRDAAALALLKLCSDIKIVFIHHGSQFPNVGIELSDVIPSPSKYIITQLRKVYKVTDLGAGLIYGFIEDYPEVDENVVMQKRKELGIKKGMLCTMSGGASYKFFDNDDKSEYFEMIREMLERNPDVRHVVLSKLETGQQQLVERIFNDSTLRERLAIMSQCPEYEPYLKCADVFIDSFPMGGAMMIVDLMRLKVPYVVKINTENILLSFHNNQAPDFKYMYRTPAEMLKGIEFLLRHPEARKTSVEENFNHFMKTFEGRAKREALIKLIESSDDFSKIYIKYEPKEKLNFDFDWFKKHKC